MIDIQQLFYSHFVSGLVNSNHKHFGGEQCYHEIPFEYHLVVCTSFCLVYAYLIYRWSHHIIDHSKTITRLPLTLLQKASVFVGSCCLVYTTYRKVVRKEGLFLLNPCHIALFMQLRLMLGDNSSLWMRRLHTLWTSWLFGPLAAISFPHLQGLSLTQAIVFFVEHLIIFPFGPLLLARRYDFLQPTLRNHTVAFGSILLYHFMVLATLSRVFKVNLNFQLCHPPADPFYPHFGHHYYILQTFNLQLVGYGLRWLCGKTIECLAPFERGVAKVE